jgi:PAS domain S-box-containing protein
MNIIQDDSFFNLSLNVNCIANTEGILLKINHQYEKVLGYTKDELLQKSFLDFVHPDDINATVEATQKLAHNLPVINFTNRYICKNGKTIILEWYASVKDNLIYASAIDLTERLDRNTEIFRLKNLLLEIGNLAKVGGFEINLSNGNIFWTENMWNIHEVDKDFIPTIDNVSAFFINKEHEDVLADLFKKAIKSKTPVETELSIKTGKGNYKHLKVYANAHYNNEGQITKIVGSIKDITQLSNALKTIKENEERYELAMESAGDGLWDWDMINDNVYFSSFWKKMLGYANHEVENAFNGWKKLWHPDDAAMIEKKIQDYLNGDSSKYEVEHRLLNKAGKWQWILTRGEIIKNEQGKPIRWAGTNTDITYLKELEKDLEDYKNLLEKAGIMANIGFYEVDFERNKVTWSKMTRLIHEAEESFVPSFEKGINFYKEGKNREIITKAVNDAINNNMPYDVELQIITAKGNEKWVRAIGTPEFLENKCVRLYGTFQDINNAKLNQLKLSETLAKNKALIEASTEIAIIGVDNNCLINIFNSGAEKLLGYTAEELIGKYTPEIFHTKDEIRDTLELASRINKKQYNSFNDLLDITKYLAQPSTKEWTYVKKDGTHFPVLLTIASAIENRGIYGWFAIAVDISVQKNKEKEIRSILNIVEDQNERLKNFTHIVSHNLRSHVANIKMMLSILTRKNTELKNNEYLIMLEEAANNLLLTINHLNDVIQINTTTIESLENINLYSCANAAINNIISLATEKNVRIINEINTEYNVLAINAYLESILLNLISNSIKYCSKNGNSYVHLSTIINDNYTILIVEDNGLGIDLERNGSKLFGMYKTFHKHEDARGVGLFITKNQIEAMGGKVEVISEVNKGTTFKVFLLNEKK